MSMASADQLLESVVGISPAPKAVGSAVHAPGGQWPTAASSGAPPAVPSPGGPAKLNYSHQAMIDLIVANPGISQNEIAARFGYSASWISMVMGTDAFKLELERRREEIVDPQLRLTVKENFEALTMQSLSILREKLNKPAEEIPDNLVLRVFDISSRAAGYGAKIDTPPPASPQEVHVHLERLGEGLVELLRRKKTEAGLPISDGGELLPHGQPETVTATVRLDSQMFEDSAIASSTKD